MDFSDFFRYYKFLLLAGIGLILFITLITIWGINNKDRTFDTEKEAKDFDSYMSGLKIGWIIGIVIMVVGVILDLMDDPRKFMPKSSPNKGTTNVGTTNTGGKPRSTIAGLQQTIANSTSTGTTGGARKNKHAHRRHRRNSV